MNDVDSWNREQLDVFNGKDALVPRHEMCHAWFRFGQQQSEIALLADG